MSLSTGENIFLYASLTGIGGIFVWLGVALYIAYAKMDLMLSYLSNCPAVMIRVPFKNGGPGGRLFLLGAIIGLMTVPHVYLRDGGASAIDLQRFPSDLKRKLIILQTVGWVLILTMIGMAVAVKLGLV